MQQYIGFKLGSNEFTIPILKVREIINTPAITRLPQAQHYMKGIINLRGRIIPIVDLKELVSIKGATAAEQSGGKVIVITNRNHTFGILVDGITSVINIDESSIEPPEHFMSGNMDRVEGVAKLDDRLLILLDTDKLVAQHELDLLGEELASATGQKMPKTAIAPTAVAHAAPKSQVGKGPAAPVGKVPVAPVTPAAPAHAVKVPVAPARATERQGAIPPAPQVGKGPSALVGKAPVAPMAPVAKVPVAPLAGKRPVAPAAVAPAAVTSVGPLLRDVHDTRQVLSRKFCEDETKNLFLQKVVELMEKMASKDFDGSDLIITEMLTHPESELYIKIGHVTRKLHNSLKEFRSALDPRIRQLANHEVPQAVDRLEYVISKSEEAAHRTMGVVEKYQLNLPELEAHVARMRAPEDSLAFMRAFCVSLGNDLNEIMLAQEYQDITGQTIHRVIDLVNTIEAELIGLIANFGVKTPEDEHAAPQTPQKITQSEVEDLLREFGF